MDKGKNNMSKIEVVDRYSGIGMPNLETSRKFYAQLDRWEMIDDWTEIALVFSCLWWW